MSTESRERLRRLVRRPGADPVEAALCIAAVGDPDVDVDVGLLRVDALADALRTAGTPPVIPHELGAWLAQQLHGEHGFTGAVEDYHDPRNALLPHVLDTRRGLPILLAVVYVGVAQRLHLPVWGIAHPGHYYVGIGARGSDTVVIDPFHDGMPVTDAELAERIRVATAGRITFTRAHLRPASSLVTTRRILNNLTRDFRSRGQVEDALWTVELKLSLPGPPPDDHLALGELLVNLGRYGPAADAFERYLDLVGEHAPDADEIRARAVRARAKLN